jgi:hypothetical protein
MYAVPRSKLAIFAMILCNDTLSGNCMAVYETVRPRLREL